MVEKHIVKLKSSDEVIFQVDIVVACKSQVLKDILEEEGIDCSMPILMVHISSDILSKAIEYCKYHSDEDQKSSHDRLTSLIDINAWDAEYVKINLATLHKLIEAADYMQIDSLLDLTSQTMANIITTKTREDIQYIFNHENNFTKEEDEEIGSESQLLASTMKALAYELQRKIKIKVGQSFHNGMWSAWHYNGGTETLIVELGELYRACDMDEQISIILLHIDISLVNTIVLQTCCNRSAHHCGSARVDWIDQVDLDLFKNLIDFIDLRKVEKLVVDDRSTLLAKEE